MCDICGRKAEVEMCALCAIDKFLELSNAIYYLNHIKGKEENKMTDNYISICKCGRYWADDLVWRIPTGRVKLKILQIELGLISNVKISTTLICDFCREKE